MLVLTSISENIIYWNNRIFLLAFWLQVLDVDHFINPSKHLAQATLEKGYELKNLTPSAI
jgi:hypothetical protein